MATTPRDESGWTIETYSAHNEALRMSEEKFQSERDRRYSEGDLLRERALQIKEEADRRALLLDREIQAYKDAKADEFRGALDDLGRQMVTRRELEAALEKIDVTIAPLLTFVSTQQGRREGLGSGSTALYGVLILALSVISILVIYATRHHA